MKGNSNAPTPDLMVGGVAVWKGWLDKERQEAIVSDLRAIVAAAPLYVPTTRGGRPMSVRMTSAGDFGWYSDSKGYRYIDRHPSGAPWPAIPDSVLAVWGRLVPQARKPESCLINFYGEGTRMGLHQDNDETDLTQPVLSISLGDDALFRIGSTQRGGPTRSVWLSSGDALVLGSDARLVYHGIDRTRFRSSGLLRDGGRINLTLRVVT